MLEAPAPLTPEQERVLRWLRNATAFKDQPDTFTVLTAGEPEAVKRVKVSFFGGLTFGRVAEPDRSNDDVAWVASLLALLATNLNVLLQRAERKNYLDASRTPER